jgi:hypothetical protein
MIDQKKAKKYLKKYGKAIKQRKPNIPTYAQYVRSETVGGSRQMRRQVQTMSPGDWNELKRFTRKEK